MQFDPKSIHEFPLLPHSDYKFIVIHAAEKKDKNSNMYLALKLKCENSKNKGNVFVNLNNARSLLNFCESTGDARLIEKFHAGRIDPEDCLDKKGKCEIGVDSYWSERDSCTKTKNAVKYWTKYNSTGANAQTAFLQDAAKQAAASRQSSHASDLEPPPFDDTIPF